jgi:hypothetical protein
MHITRMRMPSMSTTTMATIMPTNVGMSLGKKPHKRLLPPALGDAVTGCGDALGRNVGLGVGSDGLALGEADGRLVGLGVEGDKLGVFVGPDAVGAALGEREGLEEEGVWLGADVGAACTTLSASNKLSMTNSHGGGAGAARMTAPERPSRAGLRRKRGQARGGCDARTLCVRSGVIGGTLPSGAAAADRTTIAQTLRSVATAACFAVA